MKKLFIFFTLLIFCASAHAAQKRISKNTIADPVHATVTYIIDGDTFSAMVILRENIEISVRVRFINIDAPELSGECESEIVAAFAAKDRLAELIPIGAPVKLLSVKDDKYLGRINAHVIDANGRDVGEIMMAEGHAVPYAGGKRINWSK
ncbi:MAG: thermonuclease family protein [Alphaproteobacteria bacterium]|nr:thermonuclease family protein [Alphaproteobacteria bacterium]MCL2889908.1 thermonuclease family protein [Alphaproteobacteria bacterium]